MPVHQYVYFAVSSERTTVDEMTAFLGIEPDEATTRASRRTAPVAVPTAHRWKIACREPGLRVDEQIANILDRLRPHTGRIAELVGRLTTHEGRGAAVLQIVRYFSDTPEAAGLNLHAPRESANLFGWHLDCEALAFLTMIGAAVDIDEYDMTGAANDG